MPPRPTRPLPAALAVALAAAAGAAAGPGLLVRRAETYYRPPLPRTLHGLENLPASPPVDLRRPFAEEDLFALRDAGYLAGYEGRPWDRDGACTRYEALFLMGGLFAEISARHGAALAAGRTGPVRLRLPRIRWGRRRVIEAISRGVGRPKGPPWWHDAPDRYQAAGWVVDFLDYFGRRLPVVCDRRPFALDGKLCDPPYYGHPLRKRLHRVLEAHLMTAPGNTFGGRRPLRARDWVRIIERLRTVVDGYRTRPELAVP